MPEVVWQEILEKLPRKLGRWAGERATEGKLLEWNLAQAATLKVRTTVTNRWLGTAPNPRSQSQGGGVDVGVRSGAEPKTWMDPTPQIFCFPAPGFRLQDSKHRWIAPPHWPRFES